MLELSDREILYQPRKHSLPQWLVNHALLDGNNREEKKTEKKGKERIIVTERGRDDVASN